MAVPGANFGGKRVGSKELIIIVNDNSAHAVNVWDGRS